MRTVVLGAIPDELAALIERRHAAGADRHDEVWEGEYHMAPAAHPSHGYLQAEVAAILILLARAAGLIYTTDFNLGTPSDYRVPDGGVHRTLPSETWVPTAVLVVEVLSPDDESWAKLEFYAAHWVDEVVLVDGDERQLTWLARHGDHYAETSASAALGASVQQIAACIVWPGR